MTTYPNGRFELVQADDGRWQIIDKGAVWYASRDESGVRQMVAALNHAYAMGFADRDALAAQQGVPHA